MFILKLLIFLALLLFPFGELLRFDTGNNITIKPLDFVVGLAALWWVIYKVKNAKFRMQNKNIFVLPFIAFVSVGLISLIINLSWLKPQQFWVSAFYLFRFVAYTLLFPIVWQFDQPFKKKIVKFLFIDGLLLVFLGFLQYFFFNSLKSFYYLGWDEHMHRIFSTFFDPNFAGAFYVLYVLFVAGILYKNFQNRHTDMSRIRIMESLMLPRMTVAWILSFVLAISLIAVFLTFSRAAILMLIFGALIFFTLINKKRLIIFLVGLILLFIIIASPKFYDENMNLFREASSKARIVNYEFALRVIKDHLLIGVGFNTYRYAKLEYGIRERMDMPSHADAGVDNSFLFVLATTGIIGFVAYIWMWIVILKKALFLHKKRRSMAAIVVVSSIFAIFINALFINSLFFAPLMLWMFMIIGLMED
ncbi:O-antigen ligase family protein [Candidatus Roizmanbacteria bacterium]|nr:O-antigen ligase family protein [Candidatus Roizmanbacteria bacterium]